MAIGRWVHSMSQEKHARAPITAKLVGLEPIWRVGRQIPRAHRCISDESAFWSISVSNRPATGPKRFRCNCYYVTCAGKCRSNWHRCNCQTRNVKTTANRSGFRLHAIGTGHGGGKKAEPVHVILIEPPATRIRSSARATRLPIIDTGSIVLAIERTEIPPMMVFECVQRLVGATEPVHIQIIPILLRIHAECVVLNAQAAVVPCFEPNLQLHVIVVGERVQKVVAIPKFTVQVAKSIFVVGPRPIEVLRHTCRIAKATRLNYRPRQALRIERTHAIVE